MGCYAVPTVAAIIHKVLRTKKTKLKHDPHQKSLNLLFMGGAIFGIIDHLWNGELFMLGKNPVSDIMLGITITAVIYVAWKVMVIRGNMSVKEIKNVEG